MNYLESIEYLKSNCLSFFTCNNENEFKEKHDNSPSLYFIKWKGDNVFNWGTSKSNRIRKSSIFNRKLTGKYDRRVDYLMLKKIYGLDKVFIFKFKNDQDSRYHESVIKQKKNQKHCFSGIQGSNRDEISRTIYSMFKKTNWFDKFDEDLKNLFDEFFNDVFLGKLKHPTNPRRTFYYGDCLEPKFLRTIEKKYLEDPVEQILDVHFY